MFAIAGATPFEWIVLLWNLFSIPLYLITLFILIKNRNVEPFDGQFFKLCISGGIADLLVNLSFYSFCVRIWGWIDWHPLFYHPTLSWGFRMITYFNWFYMTAQVNGVALVAFNRFYNIVYKRQWKDTTLKLAIFTKWFIALVAAVPFFFLDYTVEKVEGNGGEILHSRPPKKFYSVYVIVVGGAYFSTVAITIGILYVVMFENIRQHNKAMKQTNTNTNSNGVKRSVSTEVRLAMMGFILFILLFIYCVTFAVYAYFTRSGNKEMMHLMNMLFFQLAIIQSQINPWLLIMCSKPTRKKVLKLFGFQSNTVSTVVTYYSRRNRNRSIQPAE